MINHKIIGTLIILITILACNGSDVTRPADIIDEDAIYHIIIYDRQAEFNMDLLDFSIPDTTIAPLLPDILDYYWFDSSRDSLDLIIEIDYPGTQDSLGSLPEADVEYIKIFYGSLEVMGADSVNGQVVPVRRSNPFVIRAEIQARFVKYGSDTNYRRGWLLRYISDIAYSAGYPQGITRITIDSPTYPDYILPAGINALADVPTFSPGESLTVAVTGSDPDDIFRIRYPAGGALQTFDLEPDTAGNFIAAFTLPQNAQFGHFLVEAIREASFDNPNVFGYEAVGVLYKVE